MPMNPFAVRKASAVLERRILAVIVGYFTSVILVVLGLGILMKISPELYPEPGSLQQPGLPILFYSLALSLLCAIAGGYMSAVVVREDTERVAVALGIIMVVLGIVTMALEDSVKPLWWYAVSLVMLVPCTVLGASLWRKK